MSHGFFDKKGWYEIRVQDAGMKAGHSVILGKEVHSVFGKRNTDGLWDGKKFEIAAAETATPNNIRNALKHCAAKPDCDVAVIFFPKGYSDALFEDGFGKFQGLAGTKQYKEFKEVICISANELLKEISRTAK